MNHSPTTPEERYAALAETLLSEPGVSLGEPGKKGFGASALWTHGSIFAMLAQGRLVVKLPKARVDALVAAGEGQRFDPGHGRLMKEWLSLEPASTLEWLPLAREAQGFVASKR